MVFLPFLKFMTADLATPDLRESSLLENCFASVRIWSRYLGSTTLSYSREVSTAGSRTPASANIDRSTPLAQRVDASLPMKRNSPAAMCLRASKPTVLLVQTPPLGVQNLFSALDRM